MTKDIVLTFIVIIIMSTVDFYYRAIDQDYLMHTILFYVVFNFFRTETAIKKINQHLKT